MSVTERMRTSARRESLLGDQPGAFASARFQRITPMKARRVTQMIHGLPVDDALALLQFAPQSAATTVYKVLESAIANAETTEDLERADLVVSNCQVDDPARLVRRDPDVAQDRASGGDVVADVVVTHRRRAFRSSLMWPRKVRVGANSPSLCPTIDSVMNTGTCLRPSCTAMV